jgi:hypothetical protein
MANKTCHAGNNTSNLIIHLKETLFVAKMMIKSFIIEPWKLKQIPSQVRHIMDIIEINYRSH